MICFGCNQKTTQKQNTPIMVLTQLPGKYNGQEDVWENPDSNYDSYASFGGDHYATFSRLDKNGNSLGLGLINKKGKVIIQPIYSSIAIQIKMENDIFIVNDSLHNYGIVNNQGVELVKPQYDFIHYGNSSADTIDTRLGLIKVSKNEKVGYLNRKTGQVVVPVKYDDLFVMDKNLIMFEVLRHGDDGNLTGNWGIMDFNEKIISPPRFSYPDRLKGGKTTLIAEGEEYFVYEDGRINKK